jgi:hypothetical protein
MRSRKFLWSQPPTTSVTLIETINENRSEPPTICPRRDEGYGYNPVCGGRPAAKPGLRGRCDDIGHRKSLVSLFPATCEMLVVEKSQSLLILKVFNYYVVFNF